MSYRFPHTPLNKGRKVELDWPALRADFDWLRAMTGVQQDPVYHAEGDVEIHTRMVAEAIAADKQWRKLSDELRHALFVAALLHDVAKPITTVLEDGRWTSPKHAPKGEKLARSLLLEGDAGPIPPFDLRELIAKLVRFHGLPLRFLDKPDPERAVFAASWQVDLSLLALIARADVLGRISADRQTLLDQILLFEEFCREHDCWTHPKPFASDHHRFMYFVGGKPFSYIPHDAPKCRVTVMAGLPASGKTHWLKTHAEGLPVVSLDATRELLGIRPDDRDMQAKVANATREQARIQLRAGTDFAWDATNVTRDLRDPVVALCASYGARVQIVYCEASAKETRRRNRARGDAKVPDAALTKLFERLDPPTPIEAHDVTYAISPDAPPQ